MVILVASPNIEQLILPQKMNCVLKPQKVKPEEHSNIIDWNTFFRANIDEFIQIYLDIQLHDYQKILCHIIGNRVSSTVPASRATAKSWMAAVISCAYCILYPSTKAVFASPTRGQSQLIISAIESLNKQKPNLQREIVKIKQNKDDSEVIFKNGSTITVVSMTEGGRGYRANYIVIEEAASVKKKVLDEVVLPFSFQRPAPFRMKKKYQAIKEPTRKLYIGSIKEKSNWFYDHCLRQMLIMMRGDPNGILKADQVTLIPLDYLTSLFHNIKTKEDIMSDRIGFDAISWQHEYLNIASSDNEDAFFKRGNFEKVQKTKQAWYPATTEEFISGNYKKTQRSDNERRIISVDIALSSSTKTAKNDLTAIECFRVFENGEKGFSRDLCYLETYSGANTKEQAIRIMQVMTDFDADVLILDCKGVGKGVYDTLTDTMEDKTRGIFYSAIKTMRHPSISDDVYQDLEQRAINPHAEPKIYPYIGTDRNNSNMWFSLKDKLRLSKINFLVNDIEAEGFYVKQMKDKWMEEETNRSIILKPHKETTHLISEAISLEKRVVNGYLKLIEKPKARKDRIVCMGMANFYIDFLEMEYLQGFNDEDIVKYMTSLIGIGSEGFDPVKQFQ